MRTRDLSRRRFLRGTTAGGVIAIALPRLSPMLDAHGVAYAAGGARPVRYVTWGFSNGVVPKQWHPTATGTGAAWQLSPALAPLAPWKAYLSLVGNVKVEGASQHGCANTFFVTGAKCTDRIPKAASIDQVIAAELKKTAPSLLMKSLEVGVVDAPEDEEPGRMAWSHNGPGSSNHPTYDVGEVFDRLFGPNGVAAGRGGGVVPPPTNTPGPTTPTAPSSAQLLRGARKSVLDFVIDDTKRLRAALPAYDQLRLDQHLEGIFALERRIAAAEAAETAAPPTGGGGTSGTGSTGGGAVCAAPAKKALTGGRNLDAQSADANAALSQLVALAFACDVTRVASWVVTQAGSKAQMPEIGVTDWHELSHEPNEAAKIQKFVVREVEYLAAFVKALHDTPDGDGNLLDNTAILTVNDCSDGWNHSGTDMPVAIIGKAGGKLRGDVHLRPAAEFSTAVCLTLANAVAGVTSFGAESYRRTEPIAALLK